MKPVQFARPPWTDAIFVCRKCARKAKAPGFRKELKRACKAFDRDRRVRVVDVGCLDLCPKKRIALAAGPTLTRRRLLVVSRDGCAEAAAAILGGSATTQS